MSIYLLKLQNEMLEIKKCEKNTHYFYFSLQVYWAGPMLAAPTAAFGFSFLNWNGGIRLQNRDDRKNNNEDVEDKAELTRLNSDA